MKKAFALFALLFVVMACNLSNKLKSSNSSSSSGSSSGSSIDGEVVERPNPTAAQQATLANGQKVEWSQQGITFTLPPNWGKTEVRNESFTYGGNGAFLTVAISLLPQMENYVDTSLKAMHDDAKSQQKIGKYDEAKWLELDGVRGVQHRESKQESPGDIRRLEWRGYRKYAGTTQMITMILSSDSGVFPQHQDELYAVMYSTRLVH